MIKAKMLIDREAILTLKANVLALYPMVLLLILRTLLLKCIFNPGLIIETKIQLMSLITS